MRSRRGSVHAAMSDAVLWCGILVSSGSVACVVFRSIGIPASAGALSGGLAAAWMAGGWFEWHDPDPLGLVRPILLACICFLLGAELDLTRVVRGGGSAVLGAVASSVAVMVLVWGAAMLAGIGGSASFVLAAAAGGASPAATIALTSELRARGERIQRLLLAAPAGLVTSIVAIGAARGQGVFLAGWILSLVIGAACGLVISMPLSRLSARGAIVACVGAGAVVLTGAGSRMPGGDAGVAIASIVAGFMAGNLTRNRDAVRDALRDLSLPVTVFLFAIVGAAMPAIAWPLIAAAILVATGRIVGLAAVGFVLGRRDGIVESTILVPISLLAPGLIAPGLLLDDRILPALAGAVILTQVVGPITARWLMIRTGAASASGDPDAWREAMR